MPLHNDEISSEEILYILENPWKITENEWALHLQSSPKSTLTDIEHQLKLSKNGGYSKIWKTENNSPIAILGCLKKDEERFETFFIASKHMQEHALKLSFDMREILREQSKVIKGGTCFLYSVSDHPKQINWFRFLGFTYIPEGNLGDKRYFEYVSPSK